MTKKLLSLAAALLVAGGVFAVNAASALADSPHLTVRALINNLNDSPDAGWVSNVDIRRGQRVQVYAELHNTQVGTTANNAKVRVAMPANGSSSGNFQVELSADNANTAASAVSVSAPNAVEYRYVNGSTRLTWNQDGEGAKEFDNTQVADGIAAGGYTLGNQNGCNNYIAQISFMVDVLGPEVSPSPSPTPAVGGQEQDQDQDQDQSQNQEQNNNQTTNVDVNNTNNNENNVNITVEKQNVETSNGKVPTEQPETGLPIAASAAMFGGAPVGLWIQKRLGNSVIDAGSEVSEATFVSEIFKSRLSDKV